MQDLGAPLLAAAEELALASAGAPVFTRAAPAAAGGAR
jgi:hypothetical protein